jgi:hypothetical protein
MKTTFDSHTWRKAALSTFALLAAVATAVAVFTSRFSNWDSLKRTSPDIIIARCTKTPNAFEVEGNVTRIGNPHGLWQAEIEVVCALAGRTNLGPAHLTSFYRPRQGEEYLVFAKYEEGFYYAIERYRIVPLGMSFPTNMLAGKSFDDQVRALLQYRVDMLNAEMQQAQEEKKRLEEGLK